jgi:hypothetical protein
LYTAVELKKIKRDDRPFNIKVISEEEEEEKADMLSQRRRCQQRSFDDIFLLIAAPFFLNAISTQSSRAKENSIIV